MLGKGLQDRIKRTGVAAALLLFLTPPLIACANTSHVGISLAPGGADAELQGLARRAQAGNKHAQLQLGILFEEGRGVVRDLRRAERLYRLAATDSGGTKLVHVPVAGQNPRVLTVPVNKGAHISALPAARKRLSSLKSNVRLDDLRQFKTEDIPIDFEVRKFIPNVESADCLKTQGSSIDSLSRMFRDGERLALICIYKEFTANDILSLSSKSDEAAYLGLFQLTSFDEVCSPELNTRLGVLSRNRLVAATVSQAYIAKKCSSLSVFAAYLSKALDQGAYYVQYELESLAGKLLEIPEPPE